MLVEGRSGLWSAALTRGLDVLGLSDASAYEVAKQVFFTWSASGSQRRSLDPVVGRSPDGGWTVSRTTVSTHGSPTAPVRRESGEGKQV